MESKDAELASAEVVSGLATAIHATDTNDVPAASQHHSLKYHLLGPSLTKSGQDGVDQSKVSDIIYNASKGSKYFNNEENKDKTLTVKINSILAKKRELQRIEAQGGLKKELKKADDYIAKLEYERDLSQAIVHIDCDAFYAAVEELDNPELKNVPFAVGKGVLTTCNYEARKFGCRSGMAGFVADKLCPQLIHVPLNFEKYTAKAKEVRAVLEQYDPRFESASIDEAYLNLTQYCQDHNMMPEEAVSQMREQVHQETKITISAGIAANAKLAKICSNKNKPNGQFKLLSERTTILNFMRDLPTRKVNGIGRVLERELDAIGIKTCGDLYPQRQYINRLFGEKTFEFLMGVHLGLGRTDVRPAEEHERKSVGTESTFHDMSDPQELRDKLRHTAESLEEDLQRTEFKGRTLCLKVKLHTYEVFTRQVQPPKAVYTADELYSYSLPMLQKLEKEFPGMKLRLMGLRCTHLVSIKKEEVDFFGRAVGANSHTTSTNNDAPKVDLDEDGWQKWPDIEFEDAAREERQQELEDLEQLSQEYSNVHEEKAPDDLDSAKTYLQSKGIGVGNDYTRYGNGFAWRALLEDEAKREAKASPPKKPVVQWDCPICSLPQVADERKFNEHIDGCLSRQTIKEIVKEPGSPTHEKEKKTLHLQPLAQASTAKRKRGRPPAGLAKGESSGEKRSKSSFFT
ncbi:Putative UmuC domain, DNA polymerase, Y-family, little finger domain, DNA polymerase IV [Septoria linicola]|uniref:DNA polymerase kappa n=1 Tax=Septoria linicola TaxID=215465 RepID=A0A9Q9EE69_9PEZI|nr:Putative UmuC domain, DNA polymerase, Y-family, little finger domain, DNA polymerase IV [Septoria linicola]